MKLFEKVKNMFTEEIEEEKPVIKKEALLKYETLEGKYVYEIVENGKIISEISSHHESKNKTEKQAEKPVSSDQTTKEEVVSHV